MDYYGIVKKLLGSIEPVGKSETDALRFETLGEHIKLIDLLMTDLITTAGNSNRHEYSMSRMGKAANEYLKDLSGCLLESLEDQENGN